MADRIPVAGLTLRQIEESLPQAGIDPVYATRVAHWVYRKGKASFSSLPSVAAEVRKKLDDNFTAGITSPSRSIRSADGSVRYVFDYPGGRQAETVFLPDGRRNTVCVSSQSGCARGCLYCRTGELGLAGNLTAGEIVNQVAAIPEASTVTHVVFMGMGEPLDNLPEVIRSIEIFTAHWGFSIGHSKITVSTVGIMPAAGHFLAATRSNLTLSLVSPLPAERERLVPAERLYPAAMVIDTIKNTPPAKKRRFTIAFLMFDGINDTDNHLSALIEVVAGTSLRVNLLRYHSFGNSQFRPSPPERMNHFRERLLAAGISASIRRSRGEDIDAACGLLGGIET